MMRNLLMSVVLISTLALGACTPSAGGGPVNSAGSGAVTAAVDKVMLRGTWALIVAEEMYQATNRTALAFVQSGVLPDAVLDRIQALNATARQWLDRGKAATTDAGRAAAAASALDAVFELRRIVT